MPLGDVWGNAWGDSWNSYWAAAVEAVPEVEAPESTGGYESPPRIRRKDDPYAQEQLGRRGREAIARAEQAAKDAALRKAAEAARSAAEQSKLTASKADTQKRILAALEAMEADEKERLFRRRAAVVLLML